MKYRPLLTACGMYMVNLESNVLHLRIWDEGPSHMSCDGFYGIDQSATSAQWLEYTIRARWSVEVVPGAFGRAGKVFLPSLKRAGNAQGTPFRPAFFRDGNIGKAYAPLAVQ